MEVRIVSTPPGEAPEEIRAAWIGIVLPLTVPGIQIVETVGVLSLPKNLLSFLSQKLFGKTKQEIGYIVDANQAVKILATHSPTAARWWCQQAASAIRPGKYFVFPPESCQEIKP